MPDHTEDRRRHHRGPGRRLTDALYAFLRAIRRRVDGFFGAVAAFMSVGLVLGIAVSALFASFGQVVRSGATQALDDGVLRWLSRFRSRELDAVALEITALGNFTTLIVLVLVASSFLWLTRHRYSVYLLVAAVLGGNLLNDLLKGFYARPRPEVVPWVTHVASESFPSGHAMSATIAYGSVAYLVARLEPTPAMRRVTWALAVLLILLVAASRVYLGVHYPSDVIAGIAAGAAWLVLLASTMTAIRFFSDRNPAVAREEADLHAEEERAMGLRE